MHAQIEAASTRSRLNPTDRPATSTQSMLLRVVAWISILLISNLPIIICNQLLHITVPWFAAAQFILLASGLLLSGLVQALRPLRLFFALFAALHVAEWGTHTLAGLSQANGWFANQGIAFVDSLMITQIMRLTVALVMLLISGLLFRQRSAFFFGFGNLKAVAAPIPFVGMQRPSTWHRLGPVMGLCLALGLIAFAVIAGSAPLTNLRQALPLAPFVLMFAALNAFGEEMSYRAPQLGALAPAIGESQALRITAAYFGIGHFYGVPYGIVGVLMAGVLGWLLGRSMLETKGLFWAWCIHLMMDVVIFTFMAAGSLTPGGR